MCWKGKLSLRSFSIRKLQNYEIPKHDWSAAAITLEQLNPGVVGTTWRHQTMLCLKKNQNKTRKVEGTVPTLTTWVYCITTSKYRYYISLNKSRITVHSTAVQLWLSAAGSDLHVVFGASLLHTLKTSCHPTVFCSPSSLT